LGGDEAVLGDLAQVNGFADAAADAVYAGAAFPKRPAFRAYTDGDAGTGCSLGGGVSESAGEAAERGIDDGFAAVAFG